MNPPKRLPESLRPSTGRDLIAAIGFDPESAAASPHDETRVIEYINLVLDALGEPIYGQRTDYPTLVLGETLIKEMREKGRLLEHHLPPADRRIQDFLDAYLGDAGVASPLPHLPGKTFILDRHGLARVLSLPPDRDSFESSIVATYRTSNGILHNPAKDRRTTEGVFHVVEDGLPVPGDKKAVPRVAFAELLRAALTPPETLLRLPFTASQPHQAAVWVSLLLRPVVCPAVPGFTEEKTMETRFFAPGNLIGNLDFVESIFGNAGDPHLPENDAALDTTHWTGHTGCVILAPHLITLRKKDLGLPHVSEATPRQQRDGMCWENPEELYNGGSAFKVTCRDARGVIVTLIADNYFGYCKKEVKTQISYAANLYGLAEEEHAGGALAFASYDLGEEFRLSQYVPEVDHTFADLVERHRDAMDLHPEGYATDKVYPDLVYIPEDSRITLHDQTIAWETAEGPRTLKLLPGRTYMLPSGYKVEMIKPAEGRRWRIVGTRAEGTLCHKPCTVSGGGKSEISKSIADAIIHGPVFVANVEEDFTRVEALLRHEYGMRFKDAARCRERGRPLLSPERSLGSVIKLFTPCDDYTDAYNAWVEQIPLYVKELLFLVKRFYKPDWGDDWRQRFSVDIVNGRPAHELKYRKMKLLTSYLRVGYGEDGAWRIFNLRKDFHPAAKIQCEDDITASVVVPVSYLDGLPHLSRDRGASVKFVKNCEYRLFQRPDDAVIRGYDRQTELDMSRKGNFFSNYQPLTRHEVRAMMEDAIRFDPFTAPMQARLREFEASEKPEYVVSNCSPRLVEGRPTKNPRYLQTRSDLVDLRARYIADRGARLYRRLAEGEALWPVGAVLPGRRNNPPDGAVRPLCVFNPIHYLELPELFMECISSMTGKSPSTTGAGSEGALTKGPFNALPPVVDLNNALVSLAMTGAPVFVTAAGYVGPHCRVDHDVSLLVPEIWCRMSASEKQADYLVANEFLERCEDFEWEGRLVRASILGYRINARFCQAFLGRIFSNPNAVFTPEMLAPETQDMGVFVDAIENIMATHERVARVYFEDGSVEQACPPLRALLHVMAYGEFEGMSLGDPALRALFSREAICASDWYRQRLETFGHQQAALLRRQIADLEAFLSRSSHQDEAQRLGLAQRLEEVRQRLETVSSADFVDSLQGTIGCDNSFLP